MSGESSVANLSKEFGVGQKTYGIYILGFILCIILTLIPFYAVMHQAASKQGLLVILFVSAILQFFVQTICFLRLNCQNEHGKMNVLVLTFTGVVSFIIIGGSLWIMSNLNYFMMH